MNTLQINYDQDEDIQDITVKMSFNEALALVNILGQLNGVAHKKLHIDSDMYNCLSTIFNRHDEDGAKNLHIDLKTINEE